MKKYRIDTEDDDEEDIKIVEIASFNSPLHLAL